MFMSNLIKSLALRAIARGVSLPEAQVDRASELVFLRGLLRRLAIDCVLDVGANRGQFATELRAIGFDGYIVSFEPIASEFGVMADHFRGDRKWIGRRIALGAVATQMTVNVPHLTVMSSLLESIAPEEHGVRHETVDVQRLDQVLDELIKETGCTRIFLKMDTQGYDLEVFSGASGCVERILGLQSELSIRPLYKGMPHYLEALQRYENAGYRLFNLSVVNRVATGALLELNCFMERDASGT